jgi:drug/metabolite transporter (DMT)-like permease
MSKLKTILFFISAVIDAAILTSVVSTQLVLADIKRFGLEVSIGDRVEATIHDLIGLMLPLLMLIGLSFLISFVIARYAYRTLGGNRTLWYMAAGFTSVPAAILIIKYFMGGTLLASARTSLGMFLVACCCMAGGWMFAFLSSRFGDAGTANA